MKDRNQVLTLQETEELCRLYLECRLSVLEEKELQYVLGRMESYRSPVIDEVRESMRAETIAGSFAPEMTLRKRIPKFRMWKIVSGVAASVAVVVALSVVIKDNSSLPGSYDGIASGKSEQETVIAFEGGRQLTPEESEQAVRESMKKAEALMAMAEEKNREEMRKIEYLIQKTDDKL